jgi:hypothetical protein
MGRMLNELKDQCLRIGFVAGALGIALMPVLTNNDEAGAPAQSTNARQNLDDTIKPAPLPAIDRRIASSGFEHE